MNDDFRCGVAAVIGRSNVGKSTLINRLVGRKVSIISQRPQTTRSRIMGIRTTARAQVVYIDTPGLHAGAGSLLSRCMNETSRASVEGVDFILLVIAASGWQSADHEALAIAQRQTCPVLLVINKIDRLRNRRELLPLIERVSGYMPFAEIIPVSALTGMNIDDLESSLLRYLPCQPPLFPAGQVTDRPDAFMVAELVREEVFRELRQEVPYAVAVGVEQFERTAKLVRAQAVIWVDKDSQKAIVIGHGGQRLKSIGTRARLQMQELFGCKAHLELWTKVREDWPNDAELLRALRYGDS